MIVETCAITTRVAPSFTRIGHVDLFARRASARGPDSDAHAQLAQMVRHAAFREFPDLLEEYAESSSEPPRDAHAETTCPPPVGGGVSRSGGHRGDHAGGFAGFARATSTRITVWSPAERWTTARSGSWTRTTHCLPSGPGPASTWPPAEAGWPTSPCTRALRPPLLAGGEEEATAIVAEMEAVFESETEKTWRVKLGFEADCDARTAAVADALWREKLEPLLRDVETDFVVAFRQLSSAVAADLGDDVSDDSNDSRLFEHVACAFYDEKAARSNTKLRRDWVAFLTEARRGPRDAGWLPRAAEIKKKIDAANPKYVLREWMLGEAYEAAKLSGDFAPSEALQRLTARPYEEGTEEETARYYRPAPSAVRKAGTAFMS